MKEKDIQTLFGKWLIKTCWLDNAVFELKLEKGKSFNFNKIREHQFEALHKVKYGGLYHKINDLPAFAGQKTRFSNPKPFDCFYLRGVSAYFVVVFYIPRKKKKMYFVTPEVMIGLRESFKKLGRKSIKENEMASVSHYIYDL